MNEYYVYILVSNKNGTLYTGVTSNIRKRMFEHKSNIVEGFTKKYQVHRLVYVESTNNIGEALLREKRIKKWKREWKIKLIEERNPKWKDLSDNLV